MEENEVKNEKKAFYEQWWFWLIVIILIIICMFALNNKDKKTTTNSNLNTYSMQNRAETNNITQNTSTTNTTQSTTTDINNQNIATNIADTQNAETGTSARVDEIAIQAKRDSNNVNESIKSEAVSFIKNNRKNFYKDTETMEKAMYYGYLLEYAFEDSDRDLANLGQDVYQAIKYVYRGVENIEDEATQENLRQIEEDLQKIN